jgi:hypothetical protein
MGASPELELAHAMMLQLRCGFCLHDLRNEGILTEDLAGGVGQRFELMTVKRLR